MTHGTLLGVVHASDVSFLEVPEPGSWPCICRMSLRVVVVGIHLAWVRGVCEAWGASDWDS